MRGVDEYRRLARLLLVTERADHDVHWVAWQVRALYREIPGLALTVDEIRETFALDRDTCRIVLRTLTDVGFLQQRGELVLAG